MPKTGNGLFEKVIVLLIFEKKLPHTKSNVANLLPSNFLQIGVFGLSTLLLDSPLLPAHFALI